MSVRGYALQDRVNAIFALLESDKARLKEYFSKVDVSLGPEELAEVKFDVALIQSKLEKVKALQQRDAADLAVVEAK